MVVDRLVYTTLLACGGPFRLPRFLTVTVLLGGALLHKQGVTHVLLHVLACLFGFQNVISQMYNRNCFAPRGVHLQFDEFGATAAAPCTRVQEYDAYPPPPHPPRPLRRGTPPGGDTSAFRASSANIMLA